MTNLAHNGENQDYENILNFVRPFDKRLEFSTRESGIPDDITFEIYTFFRAFYNPDLEGFSALNLHQYHILF